MRNDLVSIDADPDVLGVRGVVDGRDAAAVEEQMLEDDEIALE